MTIQVGFIGLGAMGICMAGHLQKFLEANQAEYTAPLLVWNRSVSKAQNLAAEKGVKVAASAAELIKESSIIFLMLSSDEVEKQVIADAALSQDITGKVFIDCATIHPDSARFQYERVTAAKATWIQSPVFGASPVAEAGKLIFVPSGDKEAVEKVKPLMLSMGKSTMYMGTDVTKSSVFKLTGNVFVVGLMELIAEVQAMGEAYDISDQFFSDFAHEFAGPTIGMYFNKNSKGIYDQGPNGTPYFTIENALKDTGHAVSLANKHNVRLPSIDAARKHLREADALKGDRSALDCSAVYGALRVAAGLDFENAAVKKRERSETK